MRPLKQWYEFVLDVFVWTYFAVSTMSSSREAALFPPPQEDSRRPSALGGSITTASDMAEGSHTVTERHEWQGLVSYCIVDNHLHRTHLLSGKNKDLKDWMRSLRLDLFNDVQISFVISFFSNFTEVAASDCFHYWLIHNYLLNKLIVLFCLNKMLKIVKNAH